MKFTSLKDVIRNELPRKSGIYIFRLNDGIDFLGFENNNNNRILYVGRAKNDKHNIFVRFGRHVEISPLSPTSSSGSTLRRSIGAIFKDRWNLKAFPRLDKEGNPNHYSNYNFINNKKYTKENLITNWMKNNLQYKYICSEDSEIKELEQIKKLKPTLNNHSCNDLQKKLFGTCKVSKKMSLRGLCRQEALALD